MEGKKKREELIKIHIKDMSIMSIMTMVDHIWILFGPDGNRKPLEGHVYTFSKSN